MKVDKRIVGSTIGAAMLIGLSARPVEAGYIVDLTQQGSNVVATGSGAIDLTGLTFFVITGVPALIWPSESIIHTGGSASYVVSDLYHGASGPAFGSGGETFPHSEAGDFVGVEGEPGDVYVPLGYVSDSPLSGSTTWDNQTFRSLGVTPGRYEWTWGSGANQNFTLVIVPEPSTWAMLLLGFAGVGFAGCRRGTAA